jgi:hypothetical protein
LNHPLSFLNQLTTVKRVVLQHLRTVGQGTRPAPTPRRHLVLTEVTERYHVAALLGVTGVFG